MNSFSREQMEYIVELFNPCMDDYLYVFDLQKDCYKISKHATERFLLPGDNFDDAAKAHHTFVYSEDQSRLDDEFRRIMSGEIVFHNMHYRWLDRAGKPVWINCRGRVLNDADGKPHFLVGCINEIGQKQKADNVSGLLGESSLSAYVEQFEDGLPDGFFLRIGIDDFRDINGDFGMEYGDYILKSTADCIAENIKPSQRLYRILADEFMVVDFSGGDMEAATELYKNIRKSLDTFIEENGYKSVFTISAGAVDTAKTSGTYENIMKLSEYALNTAKDQGKNRCYIYMQEDYDVFLRKKQITRQLHHAVNHGFEGFETYYQPIVDTKTRRLVGAEALMRFSMPERCEDGETKKEAVCVGEDGHDADEKVHWERISPVEFIPLLEETGLIIPAGKWMLHQAISTCSRWQKYIPNFRININLSYVQVMKSRVLTEILTALRLYGLEPSAVGIELTESGYLDTNTHFQKLWDGLKKNGVLVILDDFGTGYSNLHCLGDLRPNYIKIDRSFTLKALNNQYEHDLMTQIITMTHKLDLTICVEGIETEDEFAKISELDPDYIQGFLFGKPQPAEEFYENLIKPAIAACGTHEVSAQSVS
ncbi:EAL domain-containing protein [Roseburia intestinalis]|jgi:diguanylate cyclase (GGDEF) domain|nr:GGDEF and EAL domain-containing protein [Roseburia sp.]MTR83681.1 EAL domain-containing protein [Roseburia intestinalis]CBL08108.1 diguanylate cyclase (GGDEF) domain [Roseburia intestinalis M50/1]CBL12669.1 diguanylate cyclase (GGDEF) domain [Roseburia intestinalis XB6B4]MVQ45860.1 EAL domain-containing protein [Roseburia intestinalis]